MLGALPDQFVGAIDWQYLANPHVKDLRFCVRKFGAVVMLGLRQEDSHADTTRFHGFCVLRALRHYGVYCYGGVSPGDAVRNDERRHAKDFVADGRSNAGL
jgi:hypothetical protein